MIEPRVGWRPPYSIDRFSKSGLAYPVSSSIADIFELQFFILRVHHDLTAALQTAEENFVGQRLLDLRLDQPRHRAGAVQFVEALLGEPGAPGLGQFERDVLVSQLIAQLVDEFIDHASDAFGAQRLERDPCVKAVAEFGAEGAFDGALRLAARAADAARFGLFEAE